MNEFLNYRLLESKGYTLTVGVLISIGFLLVGIRNHPHL